MSEMVTTNIDEAQDNLLHDGNCSQYLLDWILNRLDEIEDRGNTFVLILEESGFGYILDEFENEDDEPIETSNFWYEDFE